MGSWVEAGEGRVSGTCPPTFPKQWVRRAQTLRQAGLLGRIMALSPG